MTTAIGIEGLYSGRKLFIGWQMYSWSNRARDLGWHWIEAFERNIVDDNLCSDRL
jgi:hypothetical protein